MSSSHGAGLYLLLLLAFTCKASEEPEVYQRDVTGELTEDDLMARLVTHSPEDMDWMLQRPITFDRFILKHLVGSKSDVNHREIPAPLDNAPVRPRFSPRSFLPENAPNIAFPPAFPSISNIQSVCQFSKAPVQYPEESIPKTGFGYAQRQAKAINQLQSWYGLCCNINRTEEQKICCAEEAWRKSLSVFCFEEFTIKTSHYFCCNKKGSARWTCFDKEAPHSSYQISPEDSNANITHKVKGFKFNPSICKGSLVASPRALTQFSGAPDIIFPPGRPSSLNIRQICALRKNRPRYTAKCLPRTNYGWLARQSKAINGLEREYNQCCMEKKDEDRCAERKWKKMVDKFCKEEKKTKGKKFECCEKKKREEMYACFEFAAPDKEYGLVDTVPSPPAKPPTLEAICDMHTTIQSIPGFPFSVDQMVDRCCPLVLEKRSACMEAELDNHLNDTCKLKEQISAQKKTHCCKPIIKNRSKCATKLILRYIAKAKKDNVRRKCPLPS